MTVIVPIFIDLVTKTRAEFRHQFEGQPGWLRDAAQYALDLVDEIAYDTPQAIMWSPWLLRMLPPQLPPGNGQPDSPCWFCGTVEHHKWCITRTPTRGYTLATPRMPPDWPGYPADHPRMRSASDVMGPMLRSQGLTITYQRPSADDEYGWRHGPQALATRMFGRINPHWYLDGSDAE